MEPNPRHSEWEPSRLEAVTLESEISMSIVTDASRAPLTRRRRLLERLQGRRRNDTGISDLTEMMENNDKSCFSLNVEPAFFIICLALGIQANSFTLFTYWARCIELSSKYHQPRTNASLVCSLLSDTNNTDFNDIVEKDISSTTIYIKIAGSIPTLIVAPLVGNWSDHHGRRIPLIFSLFGVLLGTFLQFFSTLYYESVSIYQFAFAAEIIMGLCGGVGMVFTSVMSIITDDSRKTLQPDNSEIPLRVAIAACMQSAGMFLGSLLMSFFAVPAIVSIEEHVDGYIKSQSLALCLIIASLIYSSIFVRESHRPNKHLFDHESDTEESSYLVDEVTHHTPSFTYRAYKKAKELYEVLIERRPGYTRLCLNLSLIFVFVEFLALDNTLLFLYLKRRPFAWSDRMFSLFSFGKGVCSMLGMILLPLLVRKINVLGKDSLLIGIGVFAGAAGFFVTSFAKSNNWIMSTCVLAIFGGAISPGYRSFLPRMVPKEQTARLLTVLSIILTFSPIISSLVFNNIYNWSLSFWPALPFFVGGVFQLFVGFGQIVIHLLMRPQWKLADELRGQRLLEEEDEDGMREDHRDEGRDTVDEERSVSVEAVGSPSDRDDSRDTLQSTATL